ncbi:ABC transporter ATP-binding protein [Chromatiales bacterium (ex Bugula neritina AB1)]|nr:ABC transporter ATP-binding protein [Chromatiales bacterium (ex Bugula neritina AB1)]
MIALENVCKTYGVGRKQHRVLDNITFTFPYRKSIGILGANGAGKSTLISIIGGAEKPDSGRVVRSSRLSWPMGYAGGFQRTLTGRENARFVARIYGADFRTVEKQTVEFSELGKYFDMPLSSYSAGMRSRFAMAVSYALDFEYYLVDEALETGDARLKEKFRQVFKERRQTASVILVSHNEQTIRRNCDVAAVLFGGTLHYFDKLDDAFLMYKKILFNKSAA